MEIMVDNHALLSGTALRYRVVIYHNSLATVH